MGNNKSIRVRFLGAAETVTGSKFLVSYGERKWLVDCGLFQGVKSLRLQNWNSLPLKASEVEAIILTHAHLDHSGFIPRFVREGFRGKIYCTQATLDLCQILLPDSGYLMEEEARYLNLKKASKHSPALPLYTEEDAVASLKYFEAVDFEKETPLGADAGFRFKYAGHILGAASAVLSLGGKRLLFSGDLGRVQDPLLFQPVAPEKADFVFVESTYGNRLHEKYDPIERLSSALAPVCARGGVTLIPAFTVGRAQLLMYYIYQLKRRKLIPDIPVYLNSPMAISATALYQKHADLHKLSPQECDEIFKSVTYVQSVEESKSLNEKKGPMIIISASGMIGGGRILHHIKAFATDEKNLILLTGFQAAGTRGRALRDGIREIKIHGAYVEIKAEVQSLDFLSAHADAAEIIGWFARNPELKPQKTFIVHGEPDAADDLRRRLSERFGWNCWVPGLMEEQVLVKGAES